MNMEIAARRFLSFFGLKNQLDKLKEETDEVIDSIKNGDFEERVSELADLRNIMAQLEVYTAECEGCSLKVLDSLIVEERVRKNIRTEERIKTGWYK